MPQELPAEKLKLLIIDGQNNHQWKKTTPVMRTFLEKSGRFTVSVSTSPARGGTEAAWAATASSQDASFPMTASRESSTLSAIHAACRRALVGLPSPSPSTQTAPLEPKI